MLRTLRQIIEMLVILIFVLSVPLIIQIIASNKSKSTEQSISYEAAQTQNDVFKKSIYGPMPDGGEVSLTKDQYNILGMDLKNIKTVALYTLALLAIISVLSFYRYKIAKDINEK